jgi:exonuclease SbcC
LVLVDRDRVIPLRLSLKNFLSYRDATLNFDGLHTACICGPNGAGKSSLLEAISWVLWGKCRAATDDDAIHGGEREAQVDFTFAYGREVYRAIRSRRRRSGSSLEFQVAPKGAALELLTFRSLTQGSIRATQAMIVERLHLDYDTFVNSAYLRQGRVDEFMLKRPGDRKQVLAELLKLSQYERLAERAKDRVKELRGATEALGQQVAIAEGRLAERPQVVADREALAAVLAAQRQRQADLELRWQRLQAVQVARQMAQGRRSSLQEQDRNLAREEERLAQDWQVACDRRDWIEGVLGQRDAIEAGLAELRRLQEADRLAAARFQRHGEIETRRQRLQGFLDRWRATWTSRRDRLTDRLTDLDRQAEELTQILARAEAIETAAAQLRQAKGEQERLERLQEQAAPLIQRLETLERDRLLVRDRLHHRIEELAATGDRLQREHQRQPELEQQLAATSAQIRDLEKLQVYQDRVREKGQERKSFIDRLEANMQDCQGQLQRLAEMADLRRDGLKGMTNEYGDCPLCQRPLDAHHRRKVQDHHQQEEQALRDRLWLLEEQKAVSEKERQVLRTEYGQLRDQLQQLGPLRERRGQLQEQLATLAAAARSRDDLLLQRQHYADALTWLENPSGPAPEPLPEPVKFWSDRVGEMEELRQRLGAIAFDDRDLALARGEVERLRRSEMQWHELQQARQQQRRLQEARPTLEEELREIQTYLQILDGPEPETTESEPEPEPKTDGADRDRGDPWIDLDSFLDRLEILEESAQNTPHKNITQDSSGDLPRESTWGDRIRTARQGLQTLTNQLSALNYRSAERDQIRHALDQAQDWLRQGETLRQCQTEAPTVAERLDRLQRDRDRLHHDRAAIATELATLATTLTDPPDPTADLEQLDRDRTTLRLAIEDEIARCGRLDQQLEALDRLQEERDRQIETLQTLRHQQTLYGELTKAFGKNGIQALVIETLLPQLEAETNRILSRLSASELHVRFITQRAKKRAGKTSKGAAIQDTDAIETLDILIADTRGPRPYETYSGGEAFRINFSIRLALARLLAQRSGTALQMLIVDEGFGTQDSAGCDRLIAAINAIAKDFKCILAITHMPHLKEAFQTRIEVHKTASGSQLAIVR